MSISTTDFIAEFDGGVADYQVPFPFHYPGNLVVDVVLVDGTIVPQVLGADYTVTDDIVTFDTNPDASSTVRIRRAMPATQETVFEVNGPLPVKEVEKALDKLTMYAQEQTARIDRRVEVSEDTDIEAFDLKLPYPAAGASIIFNEDGDGFTLGPTAAELAQADENAAAAAASAAAAATSSALAGVSADDADTHRATAEQHAVDAAASAAEAAVDVTAAIATHSALTTGIHGVSGNVVGTTDAQALTNKDLDGGTATNARRITFPAAAKATLDALTRKAGTVVYGTDTGRLYMDNGTALIQLSRTESTPSEVVMRAGVGHGSTNNKIRIFNTTAEKQVGSGITIGYSSANGHSFTISEAGIYTMNYIDNYITGAFNIGISLNATGADLTTVVYSLAAAKRLVMITAPSNIYSHVSWTTRLAVNDVIRAHTDGLPNATTDFVKFQIIKIGD